MGNGANTRILNYSHFALIFFLIMQTPFAPQQYVNCAIDEIIELYVTRIRIIGLSDIETSENVIIFKSKVTMQNIVLTFEGCIWDNNLKRLYFHIHHMQTYKFQLYDQNFNLLVV